MTRPKGRITTRCCRVCSNRVEVIKTLDRMMTTDSTLHADSHMSASTSNPWQRRNTQRRNQFAPIGPKNKNDATRSQRHTNVTYSRRWPTIRLPDNGQRHENKRRSALYERLHKPICGHKARFVIESDVCSILSSIAFLVVYV